MQRLYAQVLLALLLTTPAFASHPAPRSRPLYRDDRSTPVSVLRSLYNALNRREYARAYGYWQPRSGDLPPYPRFVEGYEGTASVRLDVGRVEAEGAAGSTFYRVPVALRATRADGTDQTFAGCYTLRLVQPGIQAPPFRPLSIVAADIRAVAANGELRVPSWRLCTAPAAAPPG